MPVIVAVACCVIVPIVAVVAVGLANLVKRAGAAPHEIPLRRRIWNSLLKG